MPLYDYSCPDCGGTEAVYRTVDKRNDCPLCSVCGVRTVKVISSYAVVADLQPYYDDNLQTHIESRKHRERVMREQGVSEAYGKGWWTSKRGRAQ